MARVGSQRQRKKKLHPVGYFHNCNTMHGFMNVKLPNFLSANHNLILPSVKQDTAKDLFRLSSKDIFLL